MFRSFIFACGRHGDGFSILFLWSVLTVWIQFSTIQTSVWARAASASALKHTRSVCCSLHHTTCPCFIGLIWVDEFVPNTEEFNWIHNLLMSVCFTSVICLLCCSNKLFTLYVVTCCLSFLGCDFIFIYYRFYFKFTFIYLF